MSSIKGKIGLFAICWVLLWALGLYVGMGATWQVSLVDAVLSNGFLGASCVVLGNILGYYQPKQDKNLFLLILILVFTVLSVLATKYVLAYIFANASFYQTFLGISVYLRGLVAFMCLTWCAAVHVLWYKLEEQGAMQQRMLATQNLAKEAELNKLRHQLQPHFLFNSLNSVYALTIVNPQEAGKMITKLSSFLRGTLREDNHAWVNVEEELEHIQLYLDIEKTRFSHRLQTVVQVDEGAKSMQLPGNLLQPIVENAIKFGLYNTAVAVTITISVSSWGNCLIIGVTNPFDPEITVAKGTGFGLNAIRRRLYLLFADNSLLTTAAKNNLFETTIKIPQLTDESSID